MLRGRAAIRNIALSRAGSVLGRLFDLTDQMHRRVYPTDHRGDCKGEWCDQRAGSGTIAADYRKRTYQASNRAWVNRSSRERGPCCCRGRVGAVPDTNVTKSHGFRVSGTYRVFVGQNTA